MINSSLDQVQGRSLVYPMTRIGVQIAGIPLLTIERHLIVRNGSLVVFVDDLTHQMYAEITSEAIKEFEFRYKQRLTYRTVNCIMKVIKFDLVFADVSLKTDLGIDLNTPVVLMLVRELEIFQRDQVERPYRSQNLVYDDKGYKRRCQVKTKRVKQEEGWDMELLTRLEEGRSLVD